MMERFDGFADTCSNAVTDFFKKNYLIILAGFLAGVYVNGFDITNTILGVDKENFWPFNESGLFWLIQERWGMALLNKIIPLTQYQFISQITGLLFLSIAGVIIIRTHISSRINRGGERRSFAFFSRRIPYSSVWKLFLIR